MNGRSQLLLSSADDRRSRRSPRHSIKLSCSRLLTACSPSMDAKASARQLTSCHNLLVESLLDEPLVVWTTRRLVASLVAYSLVSASFESFG
jgi:hypothetical protein